MNRPKWSAVHTNTQIQTKTKCNLEQLYNVSSQQDKISKRDMPSTNFVYTCCLKVGGVTWHGKNLHYKELNALNGT